MVPGASVRWPLVATVTLPAKSSASETVFPQTVTGPEAPFNRAAFAATTKTLPPAWPVSYTEKPKAIRSPATGFSMFTLPPAARKSPEICARELIEPAMSSSSPATGAAVIIEPPKAEKSPATGAVSTTETPVAYTFPGEELATSSECAPTKDAGALAARAPAGRRRKASRGIKMRCIQVSGCGWHREMP